MTDGSDPAHDPEVLRAVQTAGLGVIESAPDALIIVDRDGVIVVANAQADRLFGYRRDDLIGAPVEMLIPRSLAATHTAHRHRFMEDPHARPMGIGLDLHAVHRDGQEFPVEISLSPLHTEAGVLVVAAVRDVTERRRSEQLFRGLLESAPDALVIVDSNGRIVLLNAQSERMFGYQRQELVGSPVEKLVPDRLAGAHLPHRTRFMASPAPRAMGAGLELFAVRRDGTEFPVEISLSPLETDTGLLVSAAVRDVTDRRASERIILQARQEAEQANHAKSEFLSRMSHELRTPLNAILGFGQLLEMERMSVRQEESTRQIMKAGRHLLELIDEVLDISRIESGRLAISPEPVSIDAAVSEAIQLVVPLAGERGIVFEERSGCSGMFVLADRQRLRQVLLNLLSNAVKYNHSGGIVIFDCLPLPGGRAQLSVSDTGPGIAAELLDRIFLPFDRLGVDDPAVQGTGLGLSLSKGLVETMGGTLTVESVVGEGTTFRFDLPTAAAPDAGLSADPGARSDRTDSAAPRTVLYIEDNLSNQRLVERILELRPNLRLLSALQGGLGLDLAVTHSPDLILLDLHLPDTRGEDVLARLRSDPATRAIPVVIITADATPGQMQRLMASGAAAYLTKPLDVHEFLRTVDETTEKAEGTGDRGAGG